MAADLRVKILWAPLVTGLLICGLAGVTVVDRVRLIQRVDAVSSARGELEQLLARVTDYHERSTARAREAVFDPHLANRLAIVSWSAEHYDDDMERLITEARAALLKLQIPRADERLHTDLQRASDELGRALERVPAATQGMASLLSALEADDSELTTATAHDLEQATSEVTTDLKRAVAIVRRAIDWQLRAATSAHGLVPRWAWLALVPWAAIATYLTVRPINRLRRLALGDSVLPRTHEERALAQRELDLGRRVVDLEELANQRQREGDRAAQNARRAEHELALLKLYNDNLVNSLRAAVVVTDPVGTITGTNRAAREAFGPGETLTTHALGIAIRGRTHDLSGELASAAETRVPLRFDGVPMVRDRETLVDVTIAPYVDESGATRGFIWVCDDVTDAVRTKNQLLASEHFAAVGRLSAQVAHEIRNPLSAIGLNAELLQEDFASALSEPERSQAQALLSAIASEIERLTTVTESYLKMARLPRPSLRDADLNQLVGDLFSMLREEMKAHKIEVELDLASPAPHALVDPGQLRQGMLNIVRNGREAMPDGGKMRIRTARDNGSAVIEVADEGEGIPADAVDRVFEPFYSTKTNGTGLGLSLTQQIVSEHGGSIEIAANAPRGTRVMVVLPAP